MDMTSLRCERCGRFFDEGESVVVLLLTPAGDINGGSPEDFSVLAALHLACFQELEAGGKAGQEADEPSPALRPVFEDEEVES